MDKQKQIERVVETPEDRFLFPRLYDRLVGAEQKIFPALRAFSLPGSRC